MKALAVAVLLSACWRSSPPPTEPVVENKPTPTPVHASAPRAMTDAEQAMDAMERFADRLCDCRDARCAQEVIDDMTQWSQEMTKRGSEPPRMTEEDTKRAAEIGERAGRCMQNAMSVPAPNP